MKHTQVLLLVNHSALWDEASSGHCLRAGASGINISFVVDSKYLRKSLNVPVMTHSSCLNINCSTFICGVGTVGGHLIDQIASAHEKLKANADWEN